MKTFVYTADASSHFRGKNRTITVYRIKRNTPEYIGAYAVNTASYCGDSGTAREVIANNRKACGLSATENFNLLSM
jgi:hypothetical protein